MYRCSDNQAGHGSTFAHWERFGAVYAIDGPLGDVEHKGSPLEVIDACKNKNKGREL